MGRATLCNCYAYVKSQLPSLPSTATILANLKEDGDVVVFYYAEVGLYHYAVVRGVRDDAILIEETNYKSCAHGTRWIDKENKSIVGFFTP